jgi:hypothetical protein
MQALSLEVLWYFMSDASFELGSPVVFHSVATHTREVSSAGGEAASSKEEARKGRCGRPRPGAEAGKGPEAAYPAAGAAGEVGQESAKHEKIRKLPVLERKKIKIVREQIDQ